MQIKLSGVFVIVGGLLLLPCLAQAEATYTQKEEIAEFAARVEQGGAIDHARGQVNEETYNQDRQSADALSRAAEQEKQERNEADSRSRSRSQ